MVTTPAKHHEGHREQRRESLVMTANANLMPKLRDTGFSAISARRYLEMATECNQLRQVLLVVRAVCGLLVNS